MYPLPPPSETYHPLAHPQNLYYVALLLLP